MDQTTRASASAQSRRLGPDGLTKQQRYLEKNHQKINAKNALRNRIRRQQEKLMKEEEAEIEMALEVDPKDIQEYQLSEPLNPIKSLGSGADVPTVDRPNTLVEKSIQTDQEIQNNDPKPQGYYTSKEYYLSQEFEDLMHQKLMTLERLDRAHKAEAAYEKAIEDYDNFYAALKQRWTIHSGWKYPRRFKGSSLDEQCRRLQDILQEADELNSSVLQETPPDLPEWFDIFVQLRDIVGKRAHLQVVYYTLIDTV